MTAERGAVRNVAEPDAAPSASVGSAESRADARERFIACGVLALLCVSYVVYNVVFLPRLTNVNFGDIEFTGWSSPFASRLLRGDRPYVDFVLPIPPGSFAALAVIEKIVGRPLALEEISLNAALQLLMGLLAYFIARKLTTRKNALLTVLATLITLLELNKECAYDETAELIAWLSVLAGMSALFETNAAKKNRYWIVAGFFAGFTFSCKQSTGLGITGGWVLAFAYLAGSEISSGRAGEAKKFVLPARRYATGVAFGLSAVWLFLLLLGSTARAYYQAVFSDASTLKGGAVLFSKNIAGYLLADPAYPASLSIVVAVVAIGIAILRRHGTLHLGDEPRRKSPIRTWEAVYLALATALTFLGGAYVLARRPPYSPDLVEKFDWLKAVPLFGPAVAALFFVVHLVKVGPPLEGDDIRADPLRVGHVMNAAFIAAFACSLLHNTSAPEYRPIYDNNPIVALGFAMVFIALDRANLRWLSAVVLVSVLGGLFGNKYYRAMIATTHAEPSSYWAGMSVSPGGETMMRVARRVRKITHTDDTVLVLPEDLEIESLIGRPRPGLLGGVIFVDQYAPRLLQNDIQRLDENPPKVIVIHPREVTEWQRFFRIWSGNSATEHMMEHVLKHLLRERYRRDSSFPTMFLWEPAALDVYRRKDGDESVPPPEKGTEPTSPADYESESDSFASGASAP